MNSIFLPRIPSRPSLAAAALHCVLTAILCLPLCISPLSAQIVSWTRVYLGSAQLNAVHFPSGQRDVGYVAGNSGTILKTTDNGQTWVSLSSGTSVHLLDVFFTSTSTGWVVGNSGTILTTTNGGTTWTSQNSSTSEPLRSVSFSDASHGCTVGGAMSRTVRYTTDGGATWSIPSSIAVGGGLNTVQMMSASTAFAAGDGDGFMKTTDGGVNWSQPSWPPYNYWQCMYFIDENTGFLGGVSSVIARTNNGGASWTSTTINSHSDTLTSILFTFNEWSMLVGYASTFSGRCDDVYRTDNQSDWYARRGPNEPKIRDMYFMDDDYGIAVGQNEVFRTDVGAAYTPTFIHDGNWSDLSKWDCFKPKVNEEFVIDANCLVDETPPNPLDTGIVKSGKILDMQTYPLYASILYVEGTVRTACTNDPQYAQLLPVPTIWSTGGTCSTAEFYGTGIQHIPDAAYCNLVVSGGSRKYMSGTVSCYHLGLNGAVLNNYSGDITVGLGGITTSTSFSTSNMIIAYTTLRQQVDASHMGPTLLPTGDSTGLQLYSPVTYEIKSGTFTNPAYVMITDWGEKHWANSATRGYLNRYWNLGTANIGAPSIDLTFQYADADVGGTEAIIYTAKYTGMWTSYDRTDATTNTLRAVNLSSIAASWTGASNEILPVELVSFSALPAGDDIVLAWTTATEANNVGFDVLKSKDGLSWSKIGSVQGRGTSNVPSHYRFIDRMAARDLAETGVFYRLRQIDRDGVTHDSPVLTVSPRAQCARPELLQNYPNPFTTSTNIAFTLPTMQTAAVAIYDVMGREVYRLLEPSTMDAGMHMLTFSGASLPAGRYLLELRTESGTIRKNMSLFR
jgi:photosystem II stability/assembly factor-like uncharacterized protein